MSWHAKSAQNPVYACKQANRKVPRKSVSFLAGAFDIWIFNLGTFEVYRILDTVNIKFIKLKPAPIWELAFYERVDEDQALNLRKVGR